MASSDKSPRHGQKHPKKGIVLSTLSNSGISRADAAGLESLIALSAASSNTNGEDRYERMAYDVAGFLRMANSSPESLMEDLRKMEDVDTLNSSKASSFSFYRDIQTRHRSELESSMTKPIPIKGVHKCSKCGSDEFYMWSAQTRRADEGMTHFRQCASCGARRKE